MRGCVGRDIIPEEKKSVAILKGRAREIGECYQTLKLKQASPIRSLPESSSTLEGPRFYYRRLVRLIPVGYEEYPKKGVLRKTSL